MKNKKSNLSRWYMLPVKISILHGRSNMLMQQGYGLSYGEEEGILFLWSPFHILAKNKQTSASPRALTPFTMKCHTLKKNKNGCHNIQQQKITFRRQSMDTINWTKLVGILYNFTLCLWRAVLCFVLKLQSAQLILSWGWIE